MRTLNKFYSENPAMMSKVERIERDMEIAKRVANGETYDICFDYGLSRQSVRNIVCKVCEDILKIKWINQRRGFGQKSGIQQLRPKMIDAFERRDKNEKI